MVDNEILAVNCRSGVLYVDRYKISFILSILTNNNVFNLPPKKVAELLRKYNLVNKELFVRINKI